MNKVVISGGLGNQMFQFALAISMEAEGMPTKICTKDFVMNKHYNGFELIKAFDIPLMIDDRLKIVYFSKFLRKLCRLSRHLSSSYFFLNYLCINKNFYQEKNEFSFDEKIYEINNSYLVGGWKSLKYFYKQENLIREVFNFKKPIDDNNLTVYNRIVNSNAVAVHIRRGNYSDPSLNENRILLDSTDYYTLAFERISKLVSNPTFFIFSDDPEWVSLNFQGENIKVVSHNTGEDSYLDMYLMSTCNHFIIANSSFSWWPAWLSDNKNKVVIAPDCWSPGIDCHSIYPKNWKVVSVYPKVEEVVL